MDSSEMFISILQRYCFISYKPNVFLLFSSLAERREGHFLRVIIIAYYYSENHDYQRVTEVNNKNCVYWRTNANIVW